MIKNRIIEIAKNAGIGYGKPFHQTEDTLYIQCHQYPAEGAINTVAEDHQLQLLRFAELIIKECNYICKDIAGVRYTSDSPLNHSKEYCEGFAEGYILGKSFIATLAATKLLEHFEINEHP